MRAILINAPDIDAMRALGRGASGVVRGGVRPDDRSSSDIATTLLDRLGKDPLRARSTIPRQNAVVEWARSWLHALQVHTLVLTDAQLLNAQTLAHTLEILRDVETVLLVRGPYEPSGEDDWWDEEPVEVGNWTEWQEVITRQASQGEPPGSTGERLNVLAAGDLPVCHFLIFRALARAQLGPSHAARVDNLYVAVFAAAKDAPTEPGPMVTHLEDLIVRHAESAADAVIIVHATRAAMFHRGWFMRVDQSVLWREISPLHPRATDADWEKVAQVSDPHIAAALTLHLLHVPETSILGLTVGDVRRAVSSGRLARTDLPAQARSNLAAQLHQLRKDHDETPFMAQRNLSAIRRYARTHLRLVVQQPRRRDEGSLSGPIARLAIELVSIGGTP